MLSLLFLQHGLSSGGSAAYAGAPLPAALPMVIAPRSRPYLKVVAMLPLRFSEAPVVPTFSSHDPVPAPQPDPATDDVVIGHSAVSSLEAGDHPEDASNDSQSPGTNAPLPSIIPDDTRATARPEDFLPFFQFPVSGDVTVVVPAVPAQPASPGRLPPSSATYQQR